MKNTCNMTFALSLYIACKNISFVLELKVPNLFLKTNSHLHYLSFKIFFNLVIISLAVLFLLKFEPEKEGEVHEW